MPSSGLEFPYPNRDQMLLNTSTLTYLVVNIESREASRAGLICMYCSE